MPNKIITVIKREYMTRVKTKGFMAQGHSVFGSHLSFRLHKLTFLGNIASKARSYRGKMSTYIK